MKAEQEKKEAEAAAKAKEKKKADPAGENGNSQAFRTEPVEKRKQRETQNILDGGPGVGKYSPNVGYVQKPLVKNVDFGFKTELINQQKLQEIKKKI